MSEKWPKMPCFENGFFGFHHTVDSALGVLSELGVSASRITIQMAGRGYPARWVLAQSPSPGVELDPGVTIQLKVAGLGYFHALPVGMWDLGGESEMGTQEILDVVDDPLQKAENWVREGARLLDLRPSNFTACARWISLFGINADDWPPETWYNLALLLPKMQRLAGTESGMRLAFQLLLGLPLHEIRFLPSRRDLAEEEWSGLGAQSSRLGIDCILGDHLEDFVGAWLVAGPLTLASFYEFQQPEKKRLITLVLELCMSCQRKYWLTWLVEDPSKAPRLGIEVENSRLGINSHLGRPELAPA